MKQNLGFFTSYGIEYVFDHIGEDKIKLKIEEQETNPSGSIGISLKEFTFRDSEYAYFNGKGVLYIFDLLMQWFDDIEFDVFLFENSKRYNPLNYYEGNQLSKRWEEYKIIQRNASSREEGNLYYEANESNSYWTDYHFFYMHLSKNILKAFKNIKSIETNITGEYSFDKNKLIGDIKLELKTRRKPLTGQYLMNREAFVWYDLEPKETNENNLCYQFIKDKNTYHLIIDKNKSIGKIELIKVDPYSDEYIKIIQKINLEAKWLEVISSYTNYLKDISSSIKETSIGNSGINLANGIMNDICKYYEKKGDYAKAKVFASMNNAYIDVWREISEDHEE